MADGDSNLSDDEDDYDKSEGKDSLLEQKNLNILNNFTPFDTKS